MLKKILIIDDDETTCFLNKIFLEDMQVTEKVECLYDAREAVELIRNLCLGGSYNESGPDLILSPGGPVLSLDIVLSYWFFA